MTLRRVGMHCMRAGQSSQRAPVWQGAGGVLGGTTPRRGRTDASLASATGRDEECGRAAGLHERDAGRARRQSTSRWCPTRREASGCRSAPPAGRAPDCIPRRVDSCEPREWLGQGRYHATADAPAAVPLEAIAMPRCRRCADSLFVDRQSDGLALGAPALTCLARGWRGLLTLEVGVAAPKTSHQSQMPGERRRE